MNFCLSSLSIWDGYWTHSLLHNIVLLKRLWQKFGRDSAKIQVFKTTRNNWGQNSPHPQKLFINTTISFFNIHFLLLWLISYFSTFFRSEILSFFNVIQVQNHVLYYWIPITFKLYVKMFKISIFKNHVVKEFKDNRYWKTYQLKHFLQA